MRRIALALASLLSASALAGCISREPNVPPPQPFAESERPPYCGLRLWVPGRYERGGYWHDGAWRCVERTGTVAEGKQHCTLPPSAQNGVLPPAHLSGTGSVVPDITREHNAECKPKHQPK